MSGHMERVCLGAQPTSRKAEMRISPERERERASFRSSPKAIFGICRREEEKKHQRSPKLSSESSSSVFCCPHFHMEPKAGVGQPFVVCLEPLLASTSSSLKSLLVFTFGQQSGLCGSGKAPSLTSCYMRIVG